MFYGAYQAMRIDTIYYKNMDAGNAWIRSPAIKYDIKSLDGQISSCRMIKEKQRTRRCRETRSPDYNASTPTKCIQRKQEKSRMLVYWLAFYWAELHARDGVYIPDFSALHFSIFPTTFRTVAPTLICKSKTRCTITTVLELICIPRWNEKMLQRLYRNLSYIYFNKYRQGSRHANKQNWDNLFASCANINRRNAWVSVVFTLQIKSAVQSYKQEDRV